MNRVSENEENLEADAEELDSKSVTMLDVLEDQINIEDEVKAVLGGSDDKHCTFANGYVKRQALYSCLTCLPVHREAMGGVCLACSLHCHGGHELVEMYTKRNFKCDCGTLRFGENKCVLQPEKNEMNSNNIYNHNFKGLYCHCRRKYPDPDEDCQDEMKQCVICEDWFHDGHLDGEIPTHDVCEIVCKTCVEKHPFLSRYSNSRLKDIRNDTLEQICKISFENDFEHCTALTFPIGWRDDLCRCSKCLKMYDEQNIEYLLDPEDTLEFYVEKGREISEGQNGSKSQYELAMCEFTNLDRTTQVEAIAGYNHMKQELMEYLRTFAERKKTVRREDIAEFFEGMQAKKKSRIE